MTANEDDQFRAGAIRAYGRDQFGDCTNVSYQGCRYGQYVRSRSITICTMLDLGTSAPR